MEHTDRYPGASVIRPRGRSIWPEVFAVAMLGFITLAAFQPDMSGLFELQRMCVAMLTPAGSALN